MFDRRSSIDRQQQPSLAGTDYVLEGASLRDRFLTAFILQHSGSSASAWNQSFAQVPERPASSLLSIPFPRVEEETFNVRIESPYEPYEPYEQLTARVIDAQIADDWFGADDDDDI